MGWIKDRVFGGNMSILVNGSPTEEISNQGDHLTPFLCSRRLMSNVVNQNRYKGFEVVRGGTVISHLHMRMILFV